MGGMVKEFGAIFKMLSELFNQRIVDGKNQSLSRGLAEHGQCRINQVFHPILQINFALIEGIIEGFQLKTRDFSDEMVKTVDRLKAVEGKHRQNQFKQVLCRRLGLFRKKSGKLFPEFANDTVFRVS